MKFSRIYQKDVNNYIIVKKDGSYKSKGAYVKKLDRLDYDLPIVNKAVVEYFVHGTDPAETIQNCNRLIEFQKVVKVSEKYGYALHGNRRLSEKVLMVFASRSHLDPGVYKVKSDAERPEKIAGTPERCFIENADIREARIPRKLDKNWYIETARKRITDFLGESDDAEQVEFCRKWYDKKCSSMNRSIIPYSRSLKTAERSKTSRRKMSTSNTAPGVIKTDFGRSVKYNSAGRCVGSWEWKQK